MLNGDLLAVVNGMCEIESGAVTAAPHLFDDSPFGGGGTSDPGRAAGRSPSTARKRRSCRANLRLARKAKALKRVKAAVAEAVTRLRAYRQAEQAELRELEGVAAQSRARLVAHLLEAGNDPTISRMLALLLSRQPSPLS